MLLLLSGSGAACNNKHRGRSWPTSCRNNTRQQERGLPSQPWGGTYVQSDVPFHSKTQNGPFSSRSVLCLPNFSLSFFVIVFFFLLLCVAQQAKGVARSLSAPRYRALFICESVLCLRAIAYPPWGSQKTTLRKCLYHLHFTPTRCQTPSCITFNAIAFNGFMKK